MLKRLRKIARALAQLVQQPRVFDGDNGLGGEILDQLDLLVGERANLLTIDCDNADHPIVIEHGGGQNGPRAPERGYWFFRVFRSYVSKLDNLFGPATRLRWATPQAEARGLALVLQQMPPEHCAGRRAERIALERYETAELGPAIRTAFASMASNTGSSSPGELLMTFSTSDVAASCSNASSRSRVRRSSCSCRSAAEDTCVVGALRALSLVVRRTFTGCPLLPRRCMSPLRRVTTIFDPRQILAFAPRHHVRFGS